MAEDLSALDVGRVRSLGRLLDLKSDIVTFLEFVESDSNERVAVKEQIFVLTFRGDETKTLFSLFLYYTIHGLYKLVMKAQKGDIFETRRLF